jgi:hypothetical protein
MHAKLASVIFALVAFVPSTASCFELIDIGLFNGTGRQLQLRIDYSNGRRIDWILLPGKSILMTRGFGDHITRVSVAGRQQTYDVASLRQTILGHRRDLWLYFSRHRISVITDDEKRALEHAQRRPNQTSNQPLAVLAPVRGGSALSR